jgi:hypothetical protein
VATTKGKARSAKPRAKATKTKAKPRKKSFIRKALGPKTTSAPSRKRSWAWRFTKGTAKGTAKLVAKGSGKAAKAAGRRVERFRNGRKFADGYIPEPGEIPKRKFSRTATVAGGRRFDSPEAAMKYTEKVGASEPEPVRKERPTGSLEWGRKGKVRVRPPTTRKPPAGRHRPAKHKTKAEALIAAHRDKLTKIGSKAVDDNDIARKINKGFKEMLETRPGPLSEMDALALGMEQAMGVAAEAVENYRLNLIKRGFDPAFLVPLRNVQENYEQAATQWSVHIAVIRIELALEIAAAIRRKSGAVPDDDTLAG